MPRRIQRSRTKGWRLPEGAIYVGRPTKWGNPFVVHEHTQACLDRDFAGCPLWTAADRAEAVQRFRNCIRWPIRDDPPVPDVDDIRDALAGRDLVCWCPESEPCHADVLLRIARGEDP